MNIKIKGSTMYVDNDPVLYQYMQREHFKVKEGVYVSDDMWESFSENFEPTKSKDFEKAWKEVLKEKLQ